MKEAEATLLIATGVVEKVVLCRPEGQQWEIHVFGKDLPKYVPHRVERARGGARQWATLDSAYEWLIRIRKDLTFPIEIGGVRSWDGPTWS